MQVTPDSEHQRVIVNTMIMLNLIIYLYIYIYIDEYK